MKKIIKIERHITIQPAERKDMTVPYPYFIYAEGVVGRQDFWKGSPLKLIGFNSKPNQEADKKTIDFKIFWKSPNKCLGLYPIFQHKNREWFTYQDRISSVRIN